MSGSPWPVAERQGAGKAGVWIGAKDAKAARDSPGARLTNFETRVLKAAAVQHAPCPEAGAPVRHRVAGHDSAGRARQAALVMRASAPAGAASRSIEAVRPPSATIGSVVYTVGLPAGTKASDSLAGLVAAFDVARTHAIAHSTPLCGWSWPAPSPPARLAPVSRATRA